MSKQLLTIFFLSSILVSCGLGSSRTKDITEFTSKLSVETSEVIQIDARVDHLKPEMLNAKEYAMASHKIIAPPIFYNNIIYTIDMRGNVSAFSTTTRSIIWSYNISTNKNDHYVGGGILYHNGKLYVTYGSRFLVILESSSGHEIIRKELPDIIRIEPVLMDNHHILVQTITNQLLVMNIDNLNFVWQHEGTFETLTTSYHVAPIVQNNHNSHNGLIIVNYNSGQILALNFKGEILWSHDLSGDQQDMGLPNFEAISILCKPIVSNQSLYIANSTQLIKLNILDGKILWQRKAEDIQSMTLSGNSLFITNNAGQVGVISTESGKVKFVANLSPAHSKKPKASSFLPPLINKLGNDWNLNIISNNGQLYSFQRDANGNLGEYPQITKVPSKIEYYGQTMDQRLYFITDKKIIFMAPPG